MFTHQPLHPSIDSLLLAISIAIWGKKISVNIYPCVLSFVSFFYHIEYLADILRALREAVKSLDLHCRTISQPAATVALYAYDLYFFNCIIGWERGCNNIERVSQCLQNEVCACGA